MNMSNKDIYKDEFGQYHEVEETEEDLVDGMEDDQEDFYEDEESDDYLDSTDDEDENYDEDEIYANESGNDYDVDDE